MIELSTAALGTVKLGIAGFFGVCLRMLQKPTQSLRGWVVEVVSGIACSVYLTPLANNFIEMDARTEGGVAFLIGYTGLIIASALQDKFFKALGVNPNND